MFCFFFLKKRRGYEYSFFQFLDKFILKKSLSSVARMPHKAEVKNILVSLHAADANLNCDFWSVVKLSVTINHLYDRMAYLCGERSTAEYANYFLVQCTMACVKLCRDRTPPVSPKILSRSGGVRMSLPTTDFLKPGAYFSTQSNAAEADKCVYHGHMFIKCYCHIQTLSRMVADVVDNCVIPVSA